MTDSNEPTPNVPVRINLNNGVEFVGVWTRQLWEREEDGSQVAVVEFAISEIHFDSSLITITDGRPVAEVAREVKAWKPSLIVTLDGVEQEV